MAYLIAAIVMTLSVLKSHSPINCKPFHLWYFIFVACCTVPLHLQSFSRLLFRSVAGRNFFTFHIHFWSPTSSLLLWLSTL